MPLPAELLPRLDPLIRRLATDHDGERVATVAALERVLATAGANFHDLAGALTAPQIIILPGAPQTAPGRASWADLLAMSAELDGHADLSPWEADFITGVRGALRRGYPLSSKQCRTLQKIWERVGGDAAA